LEKDNLVLNTFQKAKTPPNQNKSTSQSNNLLSKHLPKDTPTLPKCNKKPSKQRLNLP